MLIAIELANHPPPTTRIRAITSTLTSRSNSLHDFSTASAWYGINLLLKRYRPANKNPINITIEKQTTEKIFETDIIYKLKVESFLIATKVTQFEIIKADCPAAILYVLDQTDQQIIKGSADMNLISFINDITVQEINLCLTTCFKGLEA